MGIEDLDYASRTKNFAIGIVLQDENPNPIPGGDDSLRLAAQHFRGWFGGRRVDIDDGEMSSQSGREMSSELLAILQDNVDYSKLTSHGREQYQLLKAHLRNGTYADMFDDPKQLDSSLNLLDEVANSL